MTEATKKVTTRRRKTVATKATEAKNEIVFTNVKQVSDYYHLTSKNVRRLLRSNKELLKLDKHQKNAIYAFDDEQSNAIKEFFDSKYKQSEEAK